MTHFRTSVTALGTGTPQLCAGQLVARPGTLPTLTLPLTDGGVVDVAGIWRYLHEPAEFFGVPMPAPAELEAALAGVVGAPLVAASVTLVDAAPWVLASGVAVTPLRPDAVRIAGDQQAPPAHRATDPWWRRMAARTTSGGEADQRERWLNGRGYADGLFDGVPLLGALVFETDDGPVGVENPEPTSVLDQLAQCGVFGPIDRVAACPTLFKPVVAEHVWWISPRFETHPVVEFDGTPLPVDAAARPSFARWS